MRLLLAAVPMALVATPALAQTWIDCSKSPITFSRPGNYTCYELPSGMDSHNLVLTRSGAVVGRTHDGVRLSLTTSRISSGDGYFHSWVVGKDADTRIKAFNQTTRSATNWSEMRRLDASTYTITFDAGALHCAGFIQGANSTLGGYEFLTLGYFCPVPVTAALADSEATALLSSIVLSH